MTETKAEYLVGLDGFKYSSLGDISIQPTPPPDTVLATLEAIREVVHAELARIKRDGGCRDDCGEAWLRVEALVGRVMR